MRNLIIKYHTFWNIYAIVGCLPNIVLFIMFRNSETLPLIIIMRSLLAIQLFACIMYIIGLKIR